MSLVALSIAGLGMLVAHDLPDNTVDRGIQLIVKKDRIEIDYELDMNLRMVAATLRRHNKLPKDWQDADVDSPRAADLLPLIRVHMLNALRQQLSVSINGKSQTIEAIRVEPAAIHTALLRATFRARFQSDSTDVVLEFADKNFLDQDGWRRIAAKARPPAVITESSTKPILIRIVRDLMKPLTAQQLMTTQFARIEFQIPEESLSTAAPTPTPVPDSSSVEQPAARDQQTSPARPHIGWIAVAFLLMMLLAFVFQIWGKREARLVVL